MTGLSQGEIWWADMPPPLGYRPVVLLTRNKVINRLTNVTVAPLTRTKHHVDSEIPLARQDGVEEDCVVSLDNVTTIPREYLVSRITILSTDNLNAIWEGMHCAFDLPY